MLKTALAVSLLTFQGWSGAAESESATKATQLEGSALPSVPEADATQPAPDVATSPRRATRAERGITMPNRAQVQQAKLAVLRANRGPAASAVVLTDITVALKLDPRASGSAESGERWVTPPTYSGVSTQDIVVARAFGINAKGVPVNIRPEWIAADPEMVTVSPAPGNAVQIAVHRAGESKLTVLAAGVSKDLSISATYQDQAIHVQISQ